MASENTTMPVTEGLADERTALLGAQAAVTPSKKFYRPRPLWLVPFAVTAALVRGMTLAPRVQVYTQLSCQAIYRNSDTFPTPSLSSHFTPSPANLSASHFSTHDSSNEPTLLSFIQHSESPSSNPCASDPAVQAGAAQLQTAYMLVMGITSMLSTGWWGHFGERQGRMRVLAFSTFGLLLSDLTFTLISAPQTRFSPRAGQAMLLVAPLIEGLLGGWTSLQGATTAYLADCTSAGRSRAQVFARFNGVFYAGFAFGPAIGAWLLRHPLIDFGTTNVRGQSNIAGVFALAAVFSALNLLLVLFVFPESLHSKQSSSASANTEAVVTAPWEKKSAWSEFVAGFTHAARVFSPRMHTLPGGRRKRDVSLTLLGASVFLYLLGAGIFQIKYLYAQHVYGWGSEQLSWYIFLAGGLRSITLLFLVPGVIAIFKPKRPENADPDAPPTLAQAAKEMRFDLSLARASLALDVLSHAMVSVAPISQQPMFIAFSVISSLGAGVLPTAQSIALGLVSQSPDEKLRAAGAGGVFGAMAAVQAAGQMILGPLIFGTLYARTVGPYPRAIFNAAAAIVFVSLLLLSALQAPRAPKSRRRHEAREREEQFRGRSRTPKDLRRPPVVPAAGHASGLGSGHDSFGSESASEAV